MERLKVKVNKTFPFFAALPLPPGDNTIAVNNNSIIIRKQHKTVLQPVSNNIQVRN
jgi:hypothetical protein